MANFKQICRLNISYTTKQPDVAEYLTPKGKKIYRGQISWLDGKNADGVNEYQRIEFYTTNEEIGNLFLNNKRSTFEVEGFLKIKRVEKPQGVFKPYPKIDICKAALHVKKNLGVYND